MTKIQKNCYWIVDDAEDPKMKAICTKCHKIKKIGWFWDGEKKGYGDYDLNCDVCNEIINKRD